jgi:predicted DNA-binding antitoxin AbrB/MazE fold protein
VTKTFKARVSHGLLEPMEKIDLPEGLEITITISASEIEKAAEKKNKWYIPPVSDEEQEEIEDILKNPDCHIVAFEESVKI